PNEPELSNKGLIAAIADGVSGNEGGREAAEYAVRGLLSDYYATPDTWPVTQALDRVIKASNTWLQHQSSVRPELAGMATTLTCVVLRGRFYYFAHVGDTRLYLLRGGVLTRLTTDHVWDRPEMRHVLASAVSLLVEQLPEENLRDALSVSQQLPLPPKLKVGQGIDGYRVEELIHASQTTLLYRVADPATQRKLVLKTLHPDRADDPEER